MTRPGPRAAILISGRGSNMAAILDNATAEGWSDQIALVASNRPEAEGLGLATARGVPTAVLDHQPYGTEHRGRFDTDLAELVLAHGATWVVLAGFMRILGPGFLSHFPDRILNIHPSLLPRHPGLHTHRRALEAGDREHGCTVHLVNESLDGGPILAQKAVPILPDDDEDRLAARVLVEEQRLFPQVVRAALEGRLQRSDACGDPASSSQTKAVFT
ncbi:MAG TPA: phosphoribosylglycinamide formyltransferase [Deltaproteobacteria bacterium]|nr:phosphoribosylglycinamide formyltransferase [Deltaproteobacteria bacterium]HCP47458.1 phosphoribosylglycinamide formyltransferase [Deltaproteobacteria bacterium]